MVDGFRKIRLAGGVALLLSLGGCAGFDFGLDSPTAGQSARLVRMGDFAMSRGDPVTAIALYEQALAADPDSDDALTRLAGLQQQVGATASVLDTYRNAAEAAPNDPVALRRYGNALIAETYPEKALGYLQRSLEIADTPQVRNSLGVALDLIGQHAAAQEQYRTGIAENPGDLDLGNNLALSLALGGDYADAIAMGSQVTLSDSANSRHRQTFALVLGLAGRLDEAAAMARRDLNDAQVAANLDYYQLLRSIEPSAARAIAITGGMGAPDAAAAETQVGFLIEGVERTIAPIVMMAAVPH